jgi:hypothetical protein
VTTTPESPTETLRRAAEAAPDVLPQAIADVVADYLIDCAAAIERGSSPQGLAEAAEVLALAEQQQAQDDPGERGWEFRVSPDRRHIAIWDPGNQPWFIPARSMDGWWRRDHEVDDWQRFMPASKGEQ